MKLFNKLLGEAPLFKDVVLAVANTTKTINDLIKGFTQLTRQVIEDRAAINDLYQLYGELQAEKIEEVLSSVRSSSPSEAERIDVSWSEPDKKKMVN